MLRLTAPIEELDEELGGGEWIAVTLGHSGQAPRRFGDEVSVHDVPCPVKHPLPERISQEIVFGLFRQLGKSEERVRRFIGIAAQRRRQEWLGDFKQLRIAGSRGQPACGLLRPHSRKRA